MYWLSAVGLLRGGMVRACAIIWKSWLRRRGVNIVAFKISLLGVRSLGVHVRVSHTDLSS